MPEIGGTIAKKVLPIIYAIDTSGSMTGDRIATVNEAMHECEEILREKAGDNPDAEIKIGALNFASGAQWVTKSGLVALEDFYWNDVQAGGVTDLGAAIKELESKLSRSEFLVSETGFCIPVIIFMSDGGPTDDWEKALKSANATNKWFQKARKIAIAIGDDADKDVLKELVGTSEAVVQANDLETLKSLIVAVSVSASMLAGQSRLVGDEADGGEILKDAISDVEGDVQTDDTTENNDQDSDSDSDSDADWSGDSDWN